MSSKLSVFVSHSRKDEAEKEELLSHLGVLRQAGLIDIWIDNQIAAGEDWHREIEQAITRADVAILLITKNYLGSDFVFNAEVIPLLNRRSRQELSLYPIIAKECAWRDVEWLHQMKVRPINEQPVWRDAGLFVDEELAAITEEIATKARQNSSCSPVYDSIPGTHLSGKALTQIGLSPQKGKVAMNYEYALEALGAQLEQTNRYKEFTVLEARLRENLHDEYLYGANDNNRSERARIVNSLNKLALSTFEISFNDLALGRIPAAAEMSTQELSLLNQLNVTLTPTQITPPVQTRLQELPFNELSWSQFEALCAALIEAQPVTIDCHLYGVQGDEQQGIDVVAIQTGANGNETWAYQCKRYKDYSPGKLKEAIAKMTYSADYYVLMLSIPATASVRKVANKENNIFLWDAHDIARKLKNYPALIEDFFGKAWRDVFCITEPVS